MDEELRQNVVDYVQETYNTEPLEDIPFVEIYSGWYLNNQTIHIEVNLETYTFESMVMSNIINTKDESIYEKCLSGELIDANNIFKEVDDRYGENGVDLFNNEGISSTIIPAEEFKNIYDKHTRIIINGKVTCDSVCDHI